MSDQENDIAYFIGKLIYAYKIRSKILIDRYIKRLRQMLDAHMIYSHNNLSLEDKMDIKMLGYPVREYFKIDVGVLSAAKADSYIKRLMNKYRNKKYKD